jgi:hypothetical protein
MSATIIRVKRRINEDPIDCQSIVLNSKKRKVEDDSHTTILKFVGTFETIVSYY